MWAHASVWSEAHICYFAAALSHEPAVWDDPLVLAKVGGGPLTDGAHLSLAAGAASSRSQLVSRRWLVCRDTPWTEAMLRLGELHLGLWQPPRQHARWPLRSRRLKARRRLCKLGRRWASRATRPPGPRCWRLLQR